MAKCYLHPLCLLLTLGKHLQKIINKGYGENYGLINSLRSGTAFIVCPLRSHDQSDGPQPFAQQVGIVFIRVVLSDRLAHETAQYRFPFTLGWPVSLAKQLEDKYDEILPLEEGQIFEDDNVVGETQNRDLVGVDEEWKEWCEGDTNFCEFKWAQDSGYKFSNYRLLEETARVITKPVKLPAKSCYNDRNGCLPIHLYRLKRTALARKIQLYFLPPSFTRHSTNTSYLDYETQNLYWRIDWVFPQAGNITFTDEKILDSTLLSACIHKYIDPEANMSSSLSFYQAAGSSGVKLLLKAERTGPDRYYLLDPTTTLRENLEGKSIIEYPVIHVILNYHLNEFNLLTEGTDT
ncbi:Box C/D snoRNA protein 1 [Homalodisca vitripennis]|nr:Box C/D snoRNA protein 1 [Homalodisca vitripennis]